MFDFQSTRGEKCVLHCLSDSIRIELTGHNPTSSIYYRKEEKKPRFFFLFFSFFLSRGLSKSWKKRTLRVSRGSDRIDEEGVEEEGTASPGKTSN